MKYWLVVVVSLFVVAVLANFSYAKIDPKTCVAAWFFDEEEVEEERDMSGNENHGIVKGDPNWEEGKFSKALEYDGLDVSVEVPDLHPHIKDGFTVTFWLNKIDQDLDNRWLFGSYSGWSPGATSLLIWKDEDNRNNLIFGIQGEKTGPASCSFADLSFEEWNHIAASYDKSQLKLYVNGTQVATSGFTEEVSNSNNPWYIGYKPSHKIAGLMDEVAVFNLALSADDIKTIMDEGLERVLGITAVDPSGKLAASWGSVKHSR